MYIQFTCNSYKIHKQFIYDTQFTYNSYTKHSAMLRRGSDSIFWKSTYFLLKQGSFCLMAMKFCKIVKTVIIELLVEKNLQILLRSTTEHALKNLIFNLNFTVQNVCFKLNYWCQSLYLTM